MKNIQESFNDIRSISDMMELDAPINEGLKDWFNQVKQVFKSAWTYLRGIVVKLGVYDTYGKSGPANELLDKFGLRAKDIAEKAKAAIAKKA